MPRCRILSRIPKAPLLATPLAHSFTHRAVRRRNEPVVGASGADEIAEQFSVVQRECRASVHPVLNRRQWHVRLLASSLTLKPCSLSQNLRFSMDRFYYNRTARGIEVLVSSTQTSNRSVSNPTKTNIGSCLGLDGLGHWLWGIGYADAHSSSHRNRHACS